MLKEHLGILMHHEEILRVIFQVCAVLESLCYDGIIIFSTIIVIIFKAFILAVAHHEQVPLELLLLRRVEFASFVVAVFFLGLLILIFVIVVAEAIFIILVLLVSITKWLLREVLFACIHHHLLMLGRKKMLMLLRGNTLAVELIGIKFNYRVRHASARISLWLHWIAFRVIKWLSRWFNSSLSRFVSRPPYRRFSR